MASLQTAFKSRLPDIGTTIFTRMSALAQQHNAVNLGQGFPDFACDPALIEQVHLAMQAGHNQYPQMIGVAALRQAIAAKIAKLYGHDYDADKEITITAGATQGLLTAILCAVSPGDEVIVLEPAYDSYVPAITLAGGIVKPIPLTLNRDGDQIHFSLPFDALQKAITARTRLLIINTPHNPTATIWQREDMLKLQSILSGTNILICSDEVYEHMVFDGAAHESVARFPELAERSFVISSFGKTFHVTGWKVGYVSAPAWLMAEFRKVHQYNVFTVNTPMQYGCAAYMKAATHLSLPAFYQQKRDYFLQGLKRTGFKTLHSQGTYFQCVDYTKLKLPEAKLPELEFAEFLTKDIGVAAIPLSAFYSSPTETGIIRFCFAKQEETLNAALAKLLKL